MKKILLVILAITFLNIQSTEVLANTIPTNYTYSILAVKKVYIYKQENGKTYRRLINANTAQPLTPWEEV